jgi:hypothetical protein
MVERSRWNTFPHVVQGHVTLMLRTSKALLVESVQSAQDGFHRPDDFIRDDVGLLVDRLRITDMLLVDVKERLIADKSDFLRESLPTSDIHVLRDGGRFAVMQVPECRGPITVLQDADQANEPTSHKRAE